MAYKEARDAILSPRVDEALSPINYLFACLANAFNLAQHLASLEEKELQLDWMLDIEPFRWPSELQEHFLCFGEKQAKQIRSNSKQKMADCVQSIRDALVNNNIDASAPQIKQLAHDTNDCLLGLERAAKSSKADGKSQFSEIMGECESIIFSTRPTPWRLKKADGVIQNVLGQLIDNQRAKIPDYIFLNLYRFVKRLSSPITVAEAYSSTIYGPHFILRKARGVVTNQALDREVIVRDVLWIRPLKQEPDAEGVRSEQQTNPTISLGYYLSAMDKQVYEITSISVRGTFVLIDAVAFLKQGETKSLCIHMPRIPLQRNPEAAFGSMIGALRSTQRTGAWSMLPLRPVLSDSDLLRHHFVFMFFADLFSLNVYQDRVSNYDPHIDKLYHIFADKRFCGILYSQDWLRRAKQSKNGMADGVSSEVLEQRLLSFDECFDRSGDYLTTLLGHIEMIKKEEQELFSALGEKEREILVKILLHVFKQSEQTAINPLPDYDVSAVSEILADPDRTLSLPYAGL